MLSKHVGIKCTLHIRHSCKDEDIQRANIHSYLKKKKIKMKNCLPYCQGPSEQAQNHQTQQYHNCWAEQKAIGG